MNHFSKCCRSKKASPNSLSGSAQLLDLDMTCMTVESSQSKLLRVKVQPKIPNKKSAYHDILVFPDTGASICLLGPKQLNALGLTQNDISPYISNVSVAGGSHIKTMGMFNVSIQMQGRTTEQVVYCSMKADRFFLSRQACISLGVVPSTFPYPPPINTCSNCLNVASLNLGDVERGSPNAESDSSDVEHGSSDEDHSPPEIKRGPPPEKPAIIPFAPIEANVGKLKTFLLDQFASSAFNKSKPFPKLSTPPALIHLKPDYKVPKPAYWPASVADHWADKVWKMFETDIKAKVMKRVPFNEPTLWCARMVLVKKKDGSPRRTVDYQQLNKQCLREPNYGESPFHTARRVPHNSWKSTFDAVDGYHSVELDEASSKLTTFISPWGRFRYLRFPQGHCQAGDAFNGRVQLILSNIKRMVRIVDDICIYDETIEDAFWHAWEVLYVCAKNGIVINKSKFKFCCRDIDFAGLSITSRGIQPSAKMLAAIKDFPPPTDIAKARAFFGLVTQVQWAYANSGDMAPFRDLVKPNSTFKWTEELERLFEECKKKIIGQVQEGVRKYDITRETCLQTDYSKEGLGYLLLQKYCKCSLDMAPLCCHDGWKLVFAGSRFTKGAESRYAPTEGEALAVAWALNHAHLFTKGCPNIIVSTDHRPLLGILNDKPLEDIKNPRLVRLKEQTLGFSFRMKYNRGKWHRAPDALSRNPSETIFSIAAGIFGNEHTEEEQVSVCAAELALAEISPDGSLSLDDLRKEMAIDPEMKILVSTVQSGFPRTHQLTDPMIRCYFNARDDIWIQDSGLLMFKNRLIIPQSFRQNILNTLHSAHQGVEGMRARASNSVYWPGLNSSIRNMRNNCKICNVVAPSQARQAIQLMPQPQYPFQHVCMDAFELDSHHYLAIVDKFSGWLLIFHVKTYPTRKHIIESLRSVFSSYGAPECLFTDGGLPFQAQEFESFLKRWKVQHITSSAFYPQGNGRAELAVKSAKRLLHENVNLDGSLNSYKACRALLQYRNTPIKYVGLSPSQLLFHRNLRDGLPMDPRTLRPSKLWLIAADKREEALRERNLTMAQRYNRTTHVLYEISIGRTVLIQDNGKNGNWSRSGVVVDFENRNCLIRMDGSGRIISRNRRFIKPVGFDAEADDSLLYPSVTCHRNSK